MPDPSVTVPLTVLVRHWAPGEIALCGDTAGSRTATGALVTCPVCRLEVYARLDTRRRLRRVIRAARLSR